ncbi:MAG TPA: endonuclease/exonuclease/phosphatase family protein [Bacteroidales bacterium]|nr:endonuclease/exonuclease/phosphatase family protein [Bacteroidales bacterium]HPS62025.1 endonuclease/exonuclease/phosphatase family protein [Bacteroidales bacterium]
MAKGRSIAKSFLYFLNVLAVLALLASYAAGYVSPEKWWGFAFFGLAYPVILLVNLVFVVFWLITWKKFIFVSLLVILAGFIQIRAIYPIHLTGNQPDIRPNSFKIITFNIHSLYGSRKGDSPTKTRGKVTDFFVGRKAQIVCLQEFAAWGEEYSRTLHKFARSIRLGYYSFRNYQYYSNKLRINAIVTFSNYPVANEGYFELNGNTFGIYTDMVIGRDTVRVYNVHLESIRFGNEDYLFYSHLTEQDTASAGLQEGSKRMFWKLRKAFVIRARQVDMLTRHLAGCRYPVILAGDFNDPPSSYTYRQLTRTLSDAFIERGTGLFRGTYRGKLPSYRIDHILHSRQLITQYFERINVDLSDHFPVTATLTLQPR